MANLDSILKIVNSNSQPLEGSLRSLQLDRLAIKTQQSPPVLTPQEGASSTLWCNFSTWADSMRWYLQKPPGASSSTSFTFLPETRQEGRLNATTVPKERRSSLHVSSLRTTDSGTYFCAVQHCAPRAPAACTQTLCAAQPLLQPQHTVRPPQGICSASYWPYGFETLVFIFLSICILFCARVSNL